MTVSAEDPDPNPHREWRTVVRPARDTTVTVTADGRLELYSAWADESYRYAPPAVAMWIALQRHQGRPDLAVAMLAELWGTEPVWVRFELDGWLSEIRAAGLVSYDG
ncbi:PqqD family protein [Embleya sp. NPDC050493]|uniref:PqqD family protein n=1 Tax=Embleya sp. NPDC050493 TaxID=3363989 RepID=UPI0037BBA990